MSQASDLLFIITSPRIGARREIELTQVLGGKNDSTRTPD
jgi:hypothetical protein